MNLDDFDFKPLTTGLGFDKTTENSEKKSQNIVGPKAKQSIELKTEFELPEQKFTPANNTPVSRSLKKMLDSLPPSVDFSNDSHRELKLKGPESPIPEVKTPIYRPVMDKPMAPIHQNQFDITLDNSLSQAFPKEEVSKRFFHQMVTPVPQYKEVALSTASAIIDFAIILGLASLFIVSLVFITKVDIVMMLTNNQMSQRTLFEMGALFCGVALFYFMLSRGLFGSTLGDWAFDVQLGSEKDRSHLMYPFQVLFRTFVIMVTGVILVPLVSLGFGKDIAYYFSGLKLYSRQY